MQVIMNQAAFSTLNKQLFTETRAHLLQSAPANREDGWATLYILRGSQVLATNMRLQIKAPFGLDFGTSL